MCALCNVNTLFVDTTIIIIIVCFMYIKSGYDNNCKQVNSILWVEPATKLCKHIPKSRSQSDLLTHNYFVPGLYLWHHMYDVTYQPSLFTV